VRPLAVACALAALATPAVAAGRGAPLMRPAAIRALSRDLARAYGIGHVTATCARRTRASFACRWRGRAASGSYRGDALVRRIGGRTSVALSAVRRG